MDVVSILAMGFVCMACFLMGAKVGQAVSKGEDIQTPSVNPLEAYRKHEAKKEVQKEQERIDALLRNIERYDGTASGQEDVP